MALLSKAAIIGAQDLTVKEVDVPEWGGSVNVRAMTGCERDQFESSLSVGEGKDRKQNLANIRAKLVGLCLVGADGERLFSDAEVTVLGGKSAAALDRLFDVAQKLNGLSAADVEVLAKNSEADPSGASTSV